IWYIYTMAYYSAIKSEIMAFASTWIQLEIRILSEISQKEKDKYQIISPNVESSSIFEMGTSLGVSESNQLSSHSYQCENILCLSPLYSCTYLETYVVNPHNQ
uniref:DUF1725 domain-containing protein n=1 Tax=Sus scrofa TaxID=9823 RepID=A0A8D1J7X2_PIG